MVAGVDALHVHETVVYLVGQGVARQDLYLHVLDRAALHPEFCHTDIKQRELSCEKHVCSFFVQIKLNRLVIESVDFLDIIDEGLHVTDLQSMQLFH